MFPAIGFIVACLAFNVCESQIVGGKNAKDGKYPYQASLRSSTDERHFCSGAIIYKRYIVTAAHCLDTFKSASDFFVVVGSNYLDSPGAKYEVKNFAIHSQYDPNILHNDIGLIRVSEDIKFNSNINAIKISSTDRDYDDSYSIVTTGWGLIEADNKNVPNRLQIIELKGYSRQNCQTLYNVYKFRIINSQLCTRNMEGEGVCSGDSGGPLVIEDNMSRVLIGLVSFSADPCASGRPEVHTRVFSYKSWIERTTVILERDGNGGVGIYKDYAGRSSTIQPNVILGFFVVYLCIRSIL